MYTFSAHISLGTSGIDKWERVHVLQVSAIYFILVRLLLM